MSERRDGYYLIRRQNYWDRSKLLSWEPALWDEDHWELIGYGYGDMKIVAVVGARIDVPEEDGDGG